VNCTASSNVLTVTVNSIAATISGTQTICYGGDPVAFTESTTPVVGSSLTYQWQSSLNNSTWADIVGATSATYDVPSGLTATTYYRRIVTSTLNTIACTSTSNVLTVTVQSVPTAGSIATDQTICSGGDPAAFTSVVGTGIVGSVISYIWESSTTSTTTGFSTIVGATGATYDVASGLTATTYYRRTTVATLNGVACQSVASNVVTVTVPL
jgi:hypothetical protein